MNYWMIACLATLVVLVLKFCGIINIDPNSTLALAIAGAIMSSIIVADSVEKNKPIEEEKENVDRE